MPEWSPDNDLPLSNQQAELSKEGNTYYIGGDMLTMKNTIAKIRRCSIVKAWGSCKCYGKVRLLRDLDKFEIVNDHSEKSKAGHHQGGTSFRKGEFTMFPVKLHVIIITCFCFPHLIVKISIKNSIKRTRLAIWRIYTWAQPPISSFIVTLHTATKRAPKGSYLLARESFSVSSRRISFNGTLMPRLTVPHLAFTNAWSFHCFRRSSICFFPVTMFWWQTRILHPWWTSLLALVNRDMSCMILRQLSLRQWRGYSQMQILQVAFFISSSVQLGTWWNCLSPRTILPSNGLGGLIYWQLWCPKIKSSVKLSHSSSSIYY